MPDLTARLAAVPASTPASPGTSRRSPKPLDEPLSFYAKTLICGGLTVFFALLPTLRRM